MALNIISRLAAGLLVLAFNATLASAQTTTADPTASIAKASDDCFSAVAGRLGEATTVGVAVGEFIDATDAAACRAPSVVGVPLGKVLDAVQAAVVRRRDDNHCAEAPLSPVCQGLNGVGTRIMAMRPLVGATDPVAVIRSDQTGLLNAANSLNWSPEQLTVGVSPASGVSLLKLVLKRGRPRGADVEDPGANLEAGVGPETIWDADKFNSSTEAGKTCAKTCVESTAQVTALFPLYRTLQFAFQTPVSQVTEEGAAVLETKRQRWDAYHFGGGDARVQLPWELVLNGVIFNANRPRDAEGHYAPFPEPPNHAFTFLHPSVGLALKDTKGADSNLVGVIELLGFSRWTYAEDNTRSGDWGLSLIAAYQPRDNDRDWGYGVLARLPWRGVNVAWTRTDLKAGGKDDQFLISIDVSKYLGGGAGDIAKLFKLEDPGK